MRFCIIDIHNMVHRAKHAIAAGSKAKPFDPFASDDELNKVVDDRIGAIITAVFMGVKNAFEKFGGNHCVATFDKRSWRRDFYDDYKAHRRNAVQTPEEEADKIMIDLVIDEIKTFLINYTNVTVLQKHGAEADDFVARWTQIHYEDTFTNIVVSSDSDFKQLVNNNTILYNPMSRILYTTEGVFHQDKRKSKKSETRVSMYGERWFIKQDKKGNDITFDPKWELFEKCIRGDVSDNIKSAWPRVYKSKMKAAFNGSVAEYNNFINSTWGPDDNKKSVRDAFEFNKTLIDLTAQPDDVKLMLDETIIDALDKKKARLIGAHFARFCSKYQMKKLLQQADFFNNMLSKGYSS